MADHSRPGFPLFGPLSSHNGPMPHKRGPRGPVEATRKIDERMKDLLADGCLPVVPLRIARPSLHGHFGDDPPERSEDTVFDWCSSITCSSSNPRTAGKIESNEIGAVARRLKHLSRQTGLPVVALAQLNRQADSRGAEEQPRLSDLRGSGEIEQAADVVAMLWRPKGKTSADVEEIGPDHGKTAERTGRRDDARIPKVDHSIRKLLARSPDVTPRNGRDASLLR